jgi:hypothetical protein
VRCHRWWNDVEIHLTSNTLQETGAEHLTEILRKAMHKETPEVLSCLVAFAYFQLIQLILTDIDHR